MAKSVEKQLEPVAGPSRINDSAGPPTAGLDSSLVLPLNLDQHHQQSVEKQLEPVAGPSRINDSVGPPMAGLDSSLVFPLNLDQHHQQPVEKQLEPVTGPSSINDSAGPPTAGLDSSLVLPLNLDQHHQQSVEKQLEPVAGPSRINDFAKTIIHGPPTATLDSTRLSSGPSFNLDQQVLAVSTKSPQFDSTYFPNTVIPGQHFTQQQYQQEQQNVPGALSEMGSSCHDSYSAFEDTSYSSAVGQGFQTLWGSPPVKRCRDCENHLEEIDRQKNAINQLQDENLHLKETNNRIISALKNITTSEEMAALPMMPSGRKTASSPSSPTPESENSWSRCSSVSPWSFRSMTPRPNTTPGGSTSAQQQPVASRCSSVSSLSSRAVTNTNTTPGGPTAEPQIDSLESVVQYEQLFQPGAEKMKLVEGHGLYIEAIKLQVIKSKAKKEPKKVIRELLAYFFTEEYLSRHSSTGAKSAFKGLPSEILVPMKDYMTKQYRITDAAFNEAVNRKCRDLTKKYKQTK